MKQCKTNNFMLIFFLLNTMHKSYRLCKKDLGTLSTFDLFG